MKRCLSLFLAVVIVLGIFCSVPFTETPFKITAKAASSGKVGSNITWTLDDEGTLTINGTGAIEGYFEYPWDGMRKNIKKAVIGNGITKIGGFVFDQCDNMTSVEIPDSVTSIGSQAFFMSDGITSIDIPDSVTHIHSKAFYFCANLTDINVGLNNAEYTSVDGVLYNKDKSTICIYPIGKTATTYKIPDSVTSIGDSAFEGCVNLKSMNIPNGVTVIDNQAFLGCSSLASITIPDSVKNIGEGVFRDCSMLESIKIPEGVTRIGNQAFYDCTNLSAIELPDSVTCIENYAFYQCTGLSSIIIPANIISISGGAFSGCSNLVSVSIPEGLTSVVHNAFYECTSLSEINVASGNTIYASVGGVLFNKDKTTLIKYPAAKIRGSYKIPQGVTKIERHAFYKSSSLTSIAIPDSVTNIGESAFMFCNSLTSVTIPDSVTNIGESAFMFCNSLTSVTIPDSVTSIGDAAFNQCTNLATITMPDSVTSIGGGAFYNTEYYNNSDNWENEVLYVGNHLVASSDALSGSYNIKEGTKTIAGDAFGYATGLTAVTIPDSVVSIGDSAFINCTGLTSLEIPDSVKSVGRQAFMNCTELTSIKLSKNMTGTGHCVFGNCHSLTSIEIPEGITKIGDADFYQCVGLKSITIPSTVTVIEKEAFLGCSSLSDVYYAGTKDDWAAINISKTGNSALMDARLHVKHTHTPSDWIIDEAATANSAGSQHKECTECGEVLETEVIPQLTPATPKLSKVANTASGAQVTWGEVEGADSYIVYRRTYNAKTKKWSGWSRLADGVTSTSYLDKTAKSGTYYLYTVKAVNEAGTSGYNTSGLKTYFLAMPKATTANSNSGVTVKWGKVAGATGYIVYRKTGNGKWTNLGKTTSTSFTDKTAKSGVTYRYTVKAYYSAYVSAYNTNGYAVRRLLTPTLKSVKSAKAGVTVNWSKVTGATGYIVYRKTGNGSWQKIATVTGNSKVSYLDKTAKKGTTYTYTVKAYYGTSTSAYNTKGLTIKDKY